LWIECAWWWRRWRSRTWRARGAVEGGLFQLRAEASVASCHDERKGIALHFFDVCDEFHAIGEERLPHLGALLARRAFRRPGRHVVVFLFRPLRQATHLAHRYRRRGIDELTSAMSQRLAPSELCELARSGNVVVRALANEVLVQAPPSILKALLHDPIDAEVARSVVERQVQEYGLEEARQLLRDFDDFGN